DAGRLRRLPRCRRDQGSVSVVDFAARESVYDSGRAAPAKCSGGRFQIRSAATTTAASASVSPVSGRLPLYPPVFRKSEEVICIVGVSDPAFLSACSRLKTRLLRVG